MNAIGPDRGRDRDTITPMMRFFLVSFLAVGAMGATCGPSPVPPVIDAVIDCTTQNRDRIAALIAEFQPLISGQAPAWGAVYQRAKQAGQAIGGCALAELVQNYLGNKMAPPPQADSWNAFTTLERFRREEAGNATFRTTQGNL